MKSLERVLLGGALEAKVSPSVTVSLEVATTAGALFFNFCAWILGCDPKTVHNTIGVNPSEFPQKPQHEMKVRFPGLGKSRRGHKRQGEPGATAGRGRGVEGWRGDVFGNRWSGWSCKWAVRMAGQPHLDWSLCLQATPQFSGGASAQRQPVCAEGLGPTRSSVNCHQAAGVVCISLLWSPAPPLASVGPLLEGHRTTHLSLDPVLGAGAVSQLLHGPRPWSSEMSLGAGIVQELVKITDSRTGHLGPWSERLWVTPESWHLPLAVLWLSQLGISCPPGCTASVLSPMLEKLKMLSVPGPECFITLHGSTPNGHLGSPLVAWQLASARPGNGRRQSSESARWPVIWSPLGLLRGSELRSHTQVAWDICFMVAEHKGRETAVRFRVCQPHRSSYQADGKCVM